MAMKLLKNVKAAVRSCCKSSIVRLNSTGCTEVGGGVVRIWKRGAVSLLGINRPERRNALSYEVACGLAEGLAVVQQDPSTRAVVLYGERGNLCAGYDLTQLQDDPDMIEKIKQLGLTEQVSRVPLVAAVTGYAQGPGFELALWCDFRLIEETAVFGGFAKHLGLPMSEQSCKKFVSMLGFNKALDWILTGRIVKGKEALECGIANRLVATGTGVGQAYSFACGLANMPQACLKADRASIYLAARICDETTTSELLRERDANVKQALQDFADKKYLSCEDGDVRKRKS